MSQLKVLAWTGAAFWALSVQLCWLIMRSPAATECHPQPPLPTLKHRVREFLRGPWSLSRRFLRTWSSWVLTRWHDLRGLGSRSDFLGTQPCGFFLGGALMSRIACSKHFSTSSGFQSMPVAHQTPSGVGPTAAPRIPSMSHRLVWKREVFSGKY